jgi:hypothetical protein
MKKIRTLIIVSSLLFTSIFTANAQEGYIEKLLDLNSGAQSYQLESIVSLEVLTFKNAAVQSTYDEFR